MFPQIEMLVSCDALNSPPQSGMLTNICERVPSYFIEPKVERFKENITADLLESLADERKSSEGRAIKEVEYVEEDLEGECGKERDS